MEAILLFLVGALASPLAERAVVTDGVREVIEQLMEGIDRQDAEMISNALASDAGIFATAPDGASIITVSTEAFADLHASGRFGGQERTLHISQIEVTEDLIASATVVAANDQVHYTYYVGLVKLDGAWRVQTLLQRSRPA